MVHRPAAVALPMGPHPRPTEPELHLRRVCRFVWQWSCPGIIQIGKSRPAGEAEKSGRARWTRGWGRWGMCGQRLSAGPADPVWVASPLCTQHLSYLHVIHHVITDSARWRFGIKGKFMSGGHCSPPHREVRHLFSSLCFFLESWGWSMMKKSFSGVLGLIKKTIHHHPISCRTHFRELSQCQFHSFISSYHKRFIAFLQPEFT